MSGWDWPSGAGEPLGRGVPDGSGWVIVVQV